MKTIKKDLSLLKKSSLFGAAFIVALGMNGCSSDDSASAPTFTPFERVATLAVVTTGPDDAIDYAATYTKTKAVALAIHNYVEDTDETTMTHDDGSAFPANWIIGGQDDLTGAPAFDGDPTTADGVLNIPSKDKIDPAEPAGPTNTYKVQVMDLCNSYYAKMALGAAPVIKDDDDTNDAASKVANGYIHGPALPCEVTVYNDDKNIYVDMLNPDAIFSLFFSDTVFGDQMDDAAFAEEIQKLPGDVKGELKDIIYAALDAANAGNSPYYDYTALSTPMGPAYTMNQIPGVVDSSAYDSPYLHFSYMKSDGAAFTGPEVIAVAQTIIDTMSIHDATVTEPTIGYNGKHVAALDTVLSEGSSWRSARSAPLGLPGVGAGPSPGIGAGGKNLVIEACSPKYAKEALGTEADGPGRHHAGALPCEISVKAIESAAGAGYDTLVISYLEPSFMFNAMFSDAFGSMDEATLTKYQALPSAVLADLQTIVNYAIGTDLQPAYTLKNTGRLVYNMMP